MLVKEIGVMSSSEKEELRTFKFIDKAFYVTLIIDWRIGLLPTDVELNKPV